MADTELNGNTNSLKRTHSESTSTDSVLSQTPNTVTDNNNESLSNNKENESDIHPKSEQVDVQEPPAKKMKIAQPQMPHYNSHNIYHRPPAPSSSIPLQSLPAIYDPIKPELLFTDGDDTKNEDKMDVESLSVSDLTELPPAMEQWPLCAYCRKSGDLSRCSSCRQSYYCNRDCQVAHWEVHSIICQPGPPQPPPAAPIGTSVQPPVVQYAQSPMSPGNPGHQTNYSEYNAYSADRSRGGGRPRSNSSRSRRRSSNMAYNPDADGINKEQYYCEECDRYFKNGQALGGHRSRVHSTRRGNNDGTPGSSKRKRRPSRSTTPYQGNGQYVCPHCSREFASGNALGGHISGAHTKKSKRMQRGPYDNNYSRPRF